jgi:predicted nucleic acid-binding protein
LPGLTIPGQSAVRAALDLYVDLNISYGDALTAVEMAGRGLSEVVSFDRDFDRVPWLRRVEP